MSWSLSGVCKQLSIFCKVQSCTKKKIIIKLWLKKKKERGAENKVFFIDWQKEYSIGGKHDDTHEGN